MPYPPMPSETFDTMLNRLAYNTVKQGAPAFADPPMSQLQYFWHDHPEKNKTVMARYERFGGQAEPLYGEIGREGSGYAAAEPSYPLPAGVGDAISRLPIKWRQKYLHMLGQVRPDFEGNTAGSWR